jgi:predicted dehydrogenase
MTKSINFAVVGAGGFAYFATTEFAKVPNVKLVGVYDEVYNNALRLKEIDSEVHIYNSLEELCSEPLIDLVYIATPPHLHYTQSKMALLAGKHVICEKPAAIALFHAEELRELADRKHLLFVVNLMQRYNILYQSVKELIQKKVLGCFLHGFFENYASDEFLPREHWFWDNEKSGGIFIEHGVHFFDMFSGWLGEGKIIASQKMNRPNYPNIWDRFQATVQYSNGLVNFYHGFDQPKALDRQEMRLQFERGEITLYEWVPTHSKITALCNEEQLHALKSIFPNSKIEILDDHEKPIAVKGRFKEISYQYKLKLQTSDTVEKPVLYKELVTAMFKDQLAWIRDHTHVRKIDQNNAVDSMKLAEQAELLSVPIQNLQDVAVI